MNINYEAAYRMAFPDVRLGPPTEDEKAWVRNIVDAALIETRQRQWCVLHEAPVWNVASGECIGAHHITPVMPCEIVPARIVLADYLTEEE